MKSTTSDLFPCPFCRSPLVSIVGAARRFLHYRCAACEEVWTAMRAQAAPVSVPNRLLTADRQRGSAKKITYH